jgi:hypothetical protein
MYTIGLLVVVCAVKSWVIQVLLCCWCIGHLSEMPIEGAVRTEYIFAWAEYISALFHLDLCP